MKRVLLREKPRELTGPYENPVRRWVRLREKASQFSELPAPRKIPFPKPARRKFLEGVEGVPRIHPQALQNRLNFLLGQPAVDQQLAAPLRPELSPYYVEYMAWERQMRELRRVYRAQYLQKLAEVTEQERAHEAELFELELEERRRRKQAHLQRIGEDMKRRAILQDRLRIEAKVNEAVEMAQRSKQKRRKLYWLRRTETLSQLVASAENLDDVMEKIPASTFEAGSSSRTASATGVLLSRNVSVPFLLRQLGGAKGFPQQKSRRIPHVDNIQREVLESSYDILPEDEPRFEPAPSNAPSSRERATQLYSVFTQEEKQQLLVQKIAMLQRKIEKDREVGKEDQIAIRLLDELEGARLASNEGEYQAAGKAAAKTARGSDPAGLPPWEKGE